MSLKERLSRNTSAAPATKKAEPRINPEIDARLNQFIEDNPKLLEYYQQQSREQLVRKLMLTKMNRNEYASRRDLEVMDWLNEHPEIKTRVEARVKNVPAENRPRAFVNAAKSAMIQHTMENRAPRTGISV
ncbi:MAG: hypothetical protein LBK99_15300 [Opitutaceae bacterium]|jgi:hypothetical protein|nr:hypothetical protein [Opitutaceae bacterium]